MSYLEFLDWRCQRRRQRGVRVTLVRRKPIFIDGFWPGAGLCSVSALLTHNGLLERRWVVTFENVEWWQTIWQGLFIFVLFVRVMDNSEQSIPRLRGRREKGGAEPGLGGLHHPGLVRYWGLVTGLVHGLHVIGQGGLFGGGKVTLAALVRLLTRVNGFVVI